MKKKVILFSQSPSDIKYNLFLYNKYKKNYEILIIVVNVHSNYKFFLSLRLNCKLTFIPFISIQNPIKAFFYSFKLRNIYKELFLNLKNERVFFFSDNSDYITSFFIEKLSKENNVFFVDIFNITGMELNSVKNSFIKFFTKLIFEIEIYFFDLNGKKSYKFMNDYIKKINIEFDIDELKEFNYKLSIDNKDKKNLLLFESREAKGIFTNYERNLIDFIKEYSPVYTIYIKPHPRLGYSSILNKLNVDIIEDYVPAEFLELNSFEVVTGIITVSISTINHKNKVCIIDSFDFLDNDIKKYYIDYLNRQNINNDIKYILKG